MLLLSDLFFWIPRLRMRARMLFGIWITFWLAHVPVPLMHEHSGHLEGASWSQTLSGHLSHFHAEQAGHPWFDWHIHWVAPSDLAHSADPDGELPAGAPADSDTVMLVGDSLTVPSPLAGPNLCLESAPVSGPRGGLSTTLLDHAVGPRHFWLATTRELSARVIFAVARC